MSGFLGVYCQHGAVFDERLLDEEDRRWWLWDALLRPLRLIRKYGQGH
jgi:hypothetical protein